MKVSFSVLLIVVVLCTCARKPPSTAISPSDAIPDDIQLSFFETLLAFHCSTKECNCMLAVNQVAPSDLIMQALSRRYPGAKKVTKAGWSLNEIGAPRGHAIIWIDGPVKEIDDNMLQVRGGLYLGRIGGYECVYTLKFVKGKWLMPSSNEPSLCTVS